MFLSKISQEQKELFLQLSIHAAMANNIIAKEQRVIINEYCLEMGISEVEIEAAVSLSKVLERFKILSNEQEIRIVVFEVLGLLLSDKQYDNLERNFVEELRKEFGLSNDLIERMLTLLDEFNVVFTRISDVVL
ncbi:MAG: hypothetical protein ACLKAK_11925 [Alkaliphilus sp.]